MVIDWYLLKSGTLRLQPTPATWPGGNLARRGESWFDIRDADPGSVRQFLAPFGLHPLALERCATPANVPGVISYGPGILLDFPTGFDLDATTPSHVTMLLQGSVLLTIRRGSMPDLDALPHALMSEGAGPILHLAQVVYEILDALADPRVKAQIDLRDRLAGVSRAMDEKPASVTAADLSQLHRQASALASVIENQLYTVAALDAADNEVLRHPHRKAYIQDLISELELAQRGVSRLEGGIKDLDAAFQSASSSRVERRLRILTIISAVTLPLGLIAGLLGMNVGGVPGISNSHGFLIVVGLMAVIVAAELWYFKRAGWFD
jgi:Mg2+ and Co2+ transporter CorA